MNQAPFHIVLQLLSTQDSEQSLQIAIQALRSFYRAKSCRFWKLDIANSQARGTWQACNDNTLVSCIEESFPLDQLPSTGDPFGIDGFCQTTNGYLRLACRTQFGEIGWFEILGYDPALQAKQPEWLPVVSLAIFRRAESNRDAQFSRSLRSILQGMQELLVLPDEEAIHRHAVALAHEHLGIDRCSMFLLDSSHQELQGTWTCDSRGMLLDESHLTIPVHKVIETYGRDPRDIKSWVALEGSPLVPPDPLASSNSLTHSWRAITPIPGRNGNLGVLFSDAARSRRSLDSSSQDALELHASLLGYILVERRNQSALRNADKVRLESLGTLAGGIAHDFNNLLAAILGNLELSLLSSLDERTRKRLEEAQKASLRARDVAGKLLTFARGGAPIAQPISTLHFVEQTLFSLLHESALDWQVVAEPHLPDLLIDPRQISQVFSDLVQHAQRGHWTQRMLQVRLSEDFDANAIEGVEESRAIRIEFEDNGPLLPTHTLSRIFDPYFGEEAEIGHVGLATSHSIVNRHNGTIYAQPHRSHGCALVLTLPATTAQNEPEPATNHIPTRVLVLDDEESLRLLATEILEAEGISVESVATGEEAVRAWERARNENAPFQVGLFDLLLPTGMNGQEAARQVLTLDPRARLVACSGYAADPILARPARWGFACALFKPYRMSDLLHSLEKAINHPEMEAH